MGCKRTGNLTIVSVAQDICNNALAQNDPAWMAVGCIYTLTPPPLSYEVITGDECLEDTGQPAAEIGNEEQSLFTFDHAYCPGGALTELLETLAKNKGKHTWRIEYQATTPPQAGHTNGTIKQFCGSIQAFEPGAVEKTTFMRVPVSVLRISAWTTAAKTF